jgi:Saxitoxin biosynthesis operon protein SxtJ
MVTAIEPNLARGPEPESSERSFALVFAAVLSIHGSWPLVHLAVPRWWALVLAAVFAAIAFVRPQILRPFNRGWLALGRLLHRVVSPLVIGAIFLLVVTPIALIARLRGKDVLSLRRRPELAGYWIPRPPAAPIAESMKRQF